MCGCGESWRFFAWDHYRLHTYVDNATTRVKVSGALNFKQKFRTNPTDYDKTMRVIQTLKAQLTGQQTMRGAEDIRQLQALTETISPATRHTNLTTADVTSMQKELHNLIIATSDAMHRLRTNLGMEAPASHKFPTNATPRVSPSRVQQPTTASAPRVPPPKGAATHDGLNSEGEDANNNTAA